MTKKLNQLLARVNFPLYTVHCLTERHVLVAGGGGGSKTGIRNVIEIYELINNGSTCRAESVTHFETGSEAIMNCTVFNAGNFFILFAGMEGCCQVYKIKYDYGNEERDPKTEKHTEQNHTLRERRKSSEKDLNQNLDSSDDKSDRNANLLPAKISFCITALESFQTDFSDDPFQKLVKFSSKSKILLTAGSDGHVRVWKYPHLNMLFDISAHKDDVDDLDICSNGEKIVSVSRDGTGKVWNATDGTLFTNLEYALPPKCQEKYIFRSCRFSTVDKINEKDVLFVTLNPAIRIKPPSSCYICKFNTSRYSMEKIVSTGIEMLTVMSVSDDGHFVGLGTQEGSVKIYIAFSLQLLYKMDHVHGIFVTGLEFLHACEQSQRITGGHESSLISISVDNHINIHHIPSRATIGILPLLLFFIVCMFCIFVIMDYMDL